MGVFDRSWVETLARVLEKLGTQHALVVHGQDGLDEITTTANTFVSETMKGKINNYEICPEDFGFKKAGLKELLGGNAINNANILLALLKGKPGAIRDIVILNSAAAIYTADKARSIKEGVNLASESIDSGKAFEKLELLKEFSLRE